MPFAIYHDIWSLAPGRCIGDFNTLRPRQNGRHFPDDIFKWIFFNENVWISIESSLKCVPKGQINNIPALVLLMAWRCPGDKPLSEAMVVSLLTHICVNRPQWVKSVISEHITDLVHEQFLWIQVNGKELIWWFVNSRSGNGLVPPGNRLLPESMLAEIYVHCCLMLD